MREDEEGVAGSEEEEEENEVDEAIAEVLDDEEVGDGRDENRMDEEEEIKHDEVMHISGAQDIIGIIGMMERKLARRMRNGRQQDNIKRVDEELRRADFSSPILEMFSPARVNGIAHRLGAGVVTGWTTNDPDDGEGVKARTVIGNQGRQAGRQAGRA